MRVTPSRRHSAARGFYRLPVSSLTIYGDFSDFTVGTVINFTVGAVRAPAFGGEARRDSKIGNNQWTRRLTVVVRSTPRRLRGRGGGVGPPLIAQDHTTKPLIWPRGQRSAPPSL